MDTAVKREPAAHMVPLAVEHIPVGTMTPWPLNPRQHFNKEALAELAASIEVQGVISPILIRPIPTEAKGAAGVKYQIICGERRWRAAKEAGLAHVPAVIRTLSDLEALEINLCEQKQRNDLDPLEEAAGYAKFIELHQKAGDSHTAEQIAAKIGMSRAYVYNRVKLLGLEPGCRKALLEGKIDPSRALLLARIPVASLQKEALEEILGGDYDPPMTYKVARDHIQERYMLDLRGAPFDVKDEGLVPAAGSCVKCPKRTGNQTDLFGDIKSRDVCTDPPCFQSKRQALAQRKADELKAKGKTVITGNQAAGIVRSHETYDGDVRLSVGGGYKGLDDVCHDDPKGRTVREVIGKQATDLVEIVQDPESKQLVEVVRAEKVKELLNDKGIKTAGQERHKQAQRTRKANEQAEVEEEINRRTIAAIAKKHSGKLDRQDLQLVALDMVEGFESTYGIEDAEGRVAAALGLAEGDTYNLEKRVKQMDEKSLQRFLLVMALAVTESTPELRAVAKRHKVDVDKIRRDVLAPVKPTKAPGGKKK